MATYYPAVTSEYQRLVLDDIKNYENLNRPIKTGLLKRLIIHKLPIEQLHPNPQDEFCDISIGPNYSIISDYENSFRTAIRMQQDPISFFDDPLMVEKMSTGGYMILNGHHRWLAAKRIGMKNIKVHIVNVSNDDDIISEVNSSERTMCVSFDLDEILLTDGTTYPEHKEFRFPFSRIYKKTLRRNAPVLIKELHRMGFDVWIYTGEYYPETYIRSLFALNGTKIDGVINCIRHKKSSSRLKEAFSDKYRISLHVDNNDVICVRTRFKDFEIFSIDSDNKDWASEIIQRLRENKEYWHE